MWKKKITVIPILLIVLTGLGLSFAIGRLSVISPGYNLVIQEVKESETPVGEEIVPIDINDIE